MNADQCVLKLTISPDVSHMHNTLKVTWNEIVTKSVVYVTLSKKIFKDKYKTFFPKSVSGHRHSV